MKTIVFIDGNNFYHNIKSMIRPSLIDFEKLGRLVCSLFNCKLEENKGIWYYNSVPSLKDGTVIYNKHVTFLNNLTKNPIFNVKTRKLQRRSTEEILQEKKELITGLELCKVCLPLVETHCEDCIGTIQKKEKGIDVMIAIDMLNESVIRENCDCCILISGDADFVPCLEIIEKSGKKVFSVFLTKGYSYELRNKFKNKFLSRDLLLKNCLKDKED
jgi:uncharacterized LabA/DUF88 family protein